jgi:outer membrane protein
MKAKLLTAFAAAALLTAGSASAQDWLVRVRAIYVDPAVSTDGALSALGTSVSSQFAPEVDISYFFTKNIALELIAATTKHNVSVLGADIGSVKVLPPTLTLQYHFTDLGAFKPYVGAGINYTYFYDQNLAGGTIKVDKSSFGGALQVGLDYMLDKNWLINADIKKIWMSTDVNALGVPLGTLSIDPWVFGVGVGYRF